MIHHTTLYQIDACRAARHGPARTGAARHGTARHRAAPHRARAELCYLPRNCMLIRCHPPRTMRMVASLEHVDS